MTLDYACPICGKLGERSPRYPNYVCVDCGQRAADASGRPLEFSNVSLSGGYVAWYRDDGLPYESHLCYVDGTACWANEAHMGGIVVSIYDPKIHKE